MQQQDEQPPQSHEVSNKENEEGTESEAVKDDQTASQEDSATDDEAPDGLIITMEAEENMTEENATEENATEENANKENVTEENVIEENMTEGKMADENIVEENMTEGKSLRTDTAEGQYPSKSGNEKPEISVEADVKFLEDNDRDHSDVDDSTDEISLNEKALCVSETSDSVSEDEGTVENPSEELLNGYDIQASETHLAHNHDNNEESAGNEEKVDNIADHTSEDEAFPTSSEPSIEENGVEADESESFGEKLCMPESSWETQSLESEGKYEETEEKPDPEPEYPSFTVSRDPSQSLAGNIRSISSRRPVRNPMLSVRENSIGHSVSSQNTDASRISKSSLSGSSKDEVLQTDSDSSMELHEEKTTVPVKRKAGDSAKIESKKKKLETPSYNFFSLVSSPLQSFGSKIRNGIPTVRAAVNGDQNESEDKTVEKVKACNITENTVPTDTPEASALNKQSKSWCSLM